MNLRGVAHRHFSPSGDLAPAGHFEHSPLLSVGACPLGHTQPERAASGDRGDGQYEHGVIDPVGLNWFMAHG